MLISSTRGDSNPQYSPDGSRIAFASDRSGYWEIWVCNKDGSSPQQLTHLDAASGWPSWSPDGKRVAFDSTSRGAVQIYTVSVDGAAPQQLTVNGIENTAPSWSADGWIYFQSSHSRGEYQLWKIPAAGGMPVQVTKQGGTRPAVSPDGKFVYYAKGEDQVWRVPTAGGEEARFIDGVESPDHGRWVPVDGGLYFVQRRGPERVLQFLDFHTGRTNEVMPLERPWDIFALAVSPDRRWVLFSQTDFSSHDLIMVENFR